MTRMVIAAAALLALSAGLPARLAAQSDPPPAAPAGVDALFGYFDRDLVVEAGIGFRRVRLGDGFDRVRATWGAPADTLRFGLLGRQRQWLYLAGSDTAITLTGSRSVESITVQGDMTSPYQTAEGARFGMPRHQVLALYGAPAEGDTASADYPARGIRFGFRRGTLLRFEVYRHTAGSGAGG